MQRRASLELLIAHVYLVTGAHAESNDSHSVIVNLVFLSFHCQLLIARVLVEDLSLSRVSIINSKYAVPPTALNDPFTFTEEHLLLLEVFVRNHLITHLHNLFALAERRAQLGLNLIRRIEGVADRIELLNLRLLLLSM